LSPCPVNSDPVSDPSRSGLIEVEYESRENRSNSIERRRRVLKQIEKSESRREEGREEKREEDEKGEEPERQRDEEVSKGSGVQEC